MAKYKNIVITNSGLALIAGANSGDTIEFTTIKIGSGVYNGTETLESVTELKKVEHSFGINGVTRNGTVIKLRSVFNNVDVNEGYYITEIGIYAKGSSGNEILYAIVVSEDDRADYFTPYAEFPQSITLEIYITATGVEEGVSFTASPIEGVYAAVEDLAAHIADNVKHITNSERTAWNAKLNASATAANSDKVDGYHASDFVFLTNFNAGNMDSKVKYYTASLGKDCNDIDELVVLAIGAEGLHYPVANSFYYIFTMKYTETEKKQVALEYTGNKVLVRHSRGDVWSEWKALAMADEVLALTGGTVKGSNVTNLQLENTSNETSCVGFKGSTGHLGYLGMKGSNPVYITTGNAINNLLHSGNSSKVVVSETAPTDTTALWVW